MWVVQGDPDSLAAVLENVHVGDLRARPQLEGAVSPDGDQPLDLGDAGSREGRRVLRGIDDDLAHAHRRTDGGQLGPLHRRLGPVAMERRKAILEDDDLEVGPIDLGGRVTGARRTERAEVGRRQVGPLLALGGGDDPLL